MTAGKSLALLDAFLEKYPKVENIACQTVTYGNVVSTRYVPLARARSLAAGKSALSVLNPVNRFGESSGAFPDMTQMSLLDDHWEADWTSLRPGVDPTLATVHCWVVERGQPQSQRRVRDPRAALQRAEAAANDLGLEVKVGFEVEFVFLDEDNKVISAAPSLPLFTSNATRTPFRGIVLEAVKLLESAGVGVWGFHTENAGWEIASSPNSPLNAVDDLVYIHETLKEVAWKHGYRVSFYPSHGDENTVGQHLHLSINGAKVTPTVSEQFLAGLLEHLPATTAFLNGGVDSYDPHRRFWTGAGTASWSTGKCGAIRRYEENHWEVRLGDALTSPYLQLAALLYSGMDGIKRQMKLETKSLDIGGFVEEVTQEMMDKAGIKKRLPADLKEALDTLERDRDSQGGLSEALGMELVDAYLVSKRYELGIQGALDPEARRKAVVQNI